MNRKFSLRSLRLSSIRVQIVLGFGLILGLTLLIVLFNFFSIRTLESRIQATVEEASRIRELSLEIQNEFLLARREETSFLENWRAIGFDLAEGRHAQANQGHLIRAETDLNDLNQRLSDSSVEEFTMVGEQAIALGPLLEQYEGAFQTTVEQIEERSRAGGLERRLQTTQSDLESTIRSLENPDLERIVFQMSSNEQAFFNTGEQQYIDQTRVLVLQLKDQIDAITGTEWRNAGVTDLEVLDVLEQHVAAFNELVLLDGEISINTAIFQEVTSDIGQNTGQIGLAGAAGLAAAREELEQAIARITTVSIIVGVIALASGVFVAFLLARSILGPLGELTSAARQIGRGNLSYAAAVETPDEFAALALVFNQMTEQLRGLIGSLEQLVADRTRALATSFQVSRRLSTILDQRQLLSEVVEQVRTAFDYYHAQIYLYDEARENLVMEGGTGQPGRTMLASGHKLSPGQGLVGKAAETGQPVIVSDVTKDPNWLSNRLLPATRSEIAVPIMLGDVVLGVLDVQHNIPGGLRQSDAELIQSIANQVAIALQNAKLYQDVQYKAEHETLVNRVSQRIQHAATIEHVLQVAAEELGNALGGRRTNIQLSMRSENGPETRERPHLATVGD
jgi:putative methionine-R-sulfoxide reductase with GAF domain